MIRPPAGCRAPTRGFSLLELLVVMVIVGVLAGTVVLGFVGADREQTLRTEAERLALLIEMARDSAVQRNEEWGLYVDERRYTFAVFDADEGAWREQEERPFAARATTQASLSIRVEARELAAATTQMGKRPPAVVIFSSGEQTPFEIELKPDWESRPWVVRSDGLSRVTTERAG